MNNEKYFENLSSIVNNNIHDVSIFFQTQIPDCKISNSESKIAINCPICNETRKRYKLLINLDWNNFKCFRCGESGSLFKLCKIFNIQNEFIALLSSLSNLTEFNILNLYKNEAVTETVENVDTDINYAAKFINEKSLFKINDMPSAYRYALERTYNNKIEVESYLADDKYIYIPIITDDVLVSYISRLYIESDKYQKYIIHPLIKDKINIGFYDNVITNMSSNSVYITEGYFDSYAINYAMSNYVSVCAFGKSKVVSVAEKLASNLPLDTHIYLTLDSLNKDKNIDKDNIKYGKKIANIFPNLYIVELPDMDPADILTKRGPMELKKELKNYSLPFIKYCIKYAFR